MANKTKATTATPTRTKEIDGFRTHPGAQPGKLCIQRALPMGFPYFGMQILDAEFRRYESEPDAWCVEVSATIGTIKQPYTLVLSVPQALEADVVERV